MDARTAFKFHFLEKCASAGMSPAEALVEAKAALQTVKQATLGEAAANIGTAAMYPLLGGLGLSAAAGGAIGHNLAQSSEPEFDPADIKRQELIQAMLQETARAKRQTAAIKRQSRLVPRSTHY